MSNLSRTKSRQRVLFGVLVLLGIAGACRCNRGPSEWDEESGEYRQKYSQQKFPGGNNPSTAVNFKGAQVSVDYDPKAVKAVLDAKREKGGFLKLLGVRHTRSIDDPQIEELESTWRTFKPTIAIYEGLSKHVFDRSMHIALRNGEPSFVRYLARKAKVRAETMEPSRAEQVRYLLRAGYSAEKIKAYYVMRRLSNRRLGERGAVELARKYLVELNSTPGLEKPPHTARSLGRVILRLFPELDQWWSIPRRWFDPRARGAGVYTNRLTRQLAGCRNLCMVSSISQRVREGHRVFAVVGWSHIQMQEQAFRLALSSDAESRSMKALKRILNIPPDWPAELCSETSLKPPPPAEGTDKPLPPQPKAAPPQPPAAPPQPSVAPQPSAAPPQPTVAPAKSKPAPAKSKPAPTAPAPAPVNDILRMR